jgi:hypothetical protein
MILKKVLLFFSLSMKHQMRIISAVSCLNVLKTIHPLYDFLILLDHSSGHEKQQPNGLNFENMEKTFGGQQSF